MLSRTVLIFGRRLAEERCKAFLTQEAMARVLEMSVGNLSRIERDEVKGIYRKNLPKLAAALGIDVPELISRLVVPEGYKPTPSKPKPFNLRVALDPDDWRDLRQLADGRGIDPAVLAWELILDGVRAAKQSSKGASHGHAPKLAAKPARFAEGQPRPKGLGK